MARARAGDDFLGVQNYERVPFDGNGVVPPPEDAAKNLMGTAIEPLSLAGAVRYGYEVAGVPVLVTEHGMGTPDDSLRAAFIEPSLAGLLDAIDEGVPVLGYCHWSLLDNFEWIFGYDFQYGLHEVDRDDLRAHGQAERRGVRRDRAGRRRVRLRLRRRASPGGGRPAGAGESRRAAVG